MLNKIADYIWFYIMPIFIIIGFFVVYKNKSRTHTTLDKSSIISSIKALSTQLAASIGTGNLAGVAIAIKLGGAGSIFWLWIAGIICANLKYAETSLALKYRQKISSVYYGGPMITAEKGIKNKTHAKTLAVLFSVATILSSLTTGNLIQSNLIIKCVDDSFNINPIITMTVLFVLVFWITQKDNTRILNFSGTIVPIMSVIYISSALVIIFSNLNMAFCAIKSILLQAFNIKSLFGIQGFLAVRYGFSKGIFSCEGGMGSGAIAHSQSTNTCRHSEGKIAAFGAYFDTLFVCSATAIIIIMFQNSTVNHTLEGLNLTVSAFGYFMGCGKLLVNICGILFAFSSIPAWFLYGLQSAEYLKINKQFKFISLFIIFLGNINNTYLLWAGADIANAIMAAINIIIIIILQKEI